MPRQARIVRPLDYREGDGTMMQARPGPCEVEETNLDATISWADGATRGSTAIPVDELKRHLAAGTIEWAD